MLKIVNVVTGLTTGLKVSSQVIPTCWDLPSPTRRVLCHSKEQSDFFLCQKIHIERITLTLTGRETNTHVLFLIRAEYSSCIAIFQFESSKTSTGFLGIRKMDGEVNALKLKSFLGVNIPCWLLVVIRWGGRG